MEEDQQFKRLARRSHILRSAKDLEVPLVPKRMSVLHELAATSILTTVSHFFTFGLDTIKVRVQSRHVGEDVAHFTRNRVDKHPLMTGVMKGYAIVSIGYLVHLSISKQYGIYLGCAVESLFKTWLEISKISSQMCKPNEHSLMRLAFRNCLPVGFCRDIIYRGAFAYGVKRELEHQRLTRGKFNEIQYRSSVMGFAIIGTVLSHPFDVLFTKLASQRYLKYSNPFEAIRLIYREENISKLLGSGILFRMVLMVSSSYLMAAFYNPLLNIVVDAY